MTILPPTLPFPDFKWRWASYEPTEGLNRVPVFLGVLRALASCEGEVRSSGKLRTELERVEREAFRGVRKPIRLARPEKRNLIRNSGQYWAAPGLLLGTGPKITLSALGRDVASGRVTPNEFADYTIRTFALPNPNVDSPEVLAAWKKAGLKLRPLHLVLEVLLHLAETNKEERPSISVAELVDVLIPASGGQWSASQIATSIRSLRSGKLKTTNWPSVTPEDNDERMAAEFLLFLHNYGFLERLKGKNRRADRYILVEEMIPHAAWVCNQPPTKDIVPDLPLDLFSPRSRRLASVRARPNQAAFRVAVRKGWGDRCALTGESVAEVLIAAHIIPVENEGNDDAANGILLRSDVHTLFDEQLIRIDPSGNVHLHARIENAVSYKAMSNAIPVSEASAKYLGWRWNYL